MAKKEAITASSARLLPVFDGEELLALLYVDAVPSAARQMAAELDRLARLSRTVGLSVARDRASSVTEPDGVESYLERTPVADIQRQKLLILLERHRWNISRVARLMGVTRKTIYMRLRRYGIPRQRVARGRIRRVGAS